MLIEMLTEDEDKKRNEWVERQATIVRIEDDRYLIHSNVGPAEESTRWLPAVCMR